MNGRVAFWVLFLLLVAGGASSIYRRTGAWTDGCGRVDSERLRYVATRELLPNHRLEEGDLARPRVPSSLEVEKPDVAGRYVVDGRAEGAPVVASNTRSQPRLAPPPAGATIVEVPLGSVGTLGGALDVQRRVQVIAGAETAEGRLLALTSESAFVQVSVADGKKIAGRARDAVCALLPLAPLQ